MGAHNFNFAAKCPPKCGFSAANLVSLDKNFPPNRFSDIFPMVKKFGWALGVVPHASHATTSLVRRPVTERTWQRRVS